ncbi:MAG: ImmA/IrrE family metallo-endopeptidase [Myxococcales bacterium]|nr:ImmA/IrrE family metallo-endopeptidase [Myxococcales bacterium]
MRLAPLPVRRARKAATALHDRFHLRDPQDLDVEGIAALLGLQVRVGDLHGAAARLVGAPTGGIIRLSDRIEHSGARRFSVAHEIGHCQLGHRSTATAAVCASTDVHGHVDRGAEAEANAFAAELLMPERLVRRRCEVSPVSLEPVRAIADNFGVSLLAAALRFVELTSERCALVFSRARHIVWAAHSPTFLPFIERGRCLDPDSLAFDWFSSALASSGPQLVPADAWVSHDAAADAELQEDVFVVPGMDGVASLLWIPEAAACAFERGGDDATDRHRAGGSTFSQ